MSTFRMFRIILHGTDDIDGKVSALKAVLERHDGTRALGTVGVRVSGKAYSVTRNATSITVRPA